MTAAARQQGFAERMNAARHDLTEDRRDLEQLAATVRHIAEARIEIARRGDDKPALAENLRLLGEVTAFEVGLGIPHTDVPAMVEAMLAGIQGRTPKLSHWQRIAAAETPEIDPEWADYERLHAKFAGIAPADVPNLHPAPRGLGSE